MYYSKILFKFKSLFFVDRWCIKFLYLIENKEWEALNKKIKFKTPQNENVGNLLILLENLFDYTLFQKKILRKKKLDEKLLLKLIRQNKSMINTFITRDFHIKIIMSRLKFPPQGKMMKKLLQLFGEFGRVSLVFRKLK